MIIKDIGWVAHRQPVKDAGWALIAGTVSAIDCVIVTLTAAEGTRGFGTISTLLPFDPPVAAIEAALREFAPLVVGRATGDIGSVSTVLASKLHGFAPVKAESAKLQHTRRR
jgi:hypothetical protein